MATVDPLWEYLEKIDITPYRVAKEIGLPTSQLSQWKTGKVNPSLDALIAIADYLNVSLDYLVGRSDDPNRH